MTEPPKRKLIWMDTSKVGLLHCDVCTLDLPEPLSFDEFASGKLIGFKCPRCYANMLTERDWKDTMRFFRVMTWINKWFGWLGWKEPPARAKTIEIKHHAGRVEHRGIPR
jgi:hypothetical protein